MNICVSNINKNLLYINVIYILIIIEMLITQTNSFDILVL